MLYRFFSYFTVGFFLFVFQNCNTKTTDEPILTSEDFFEPEHNKSSEVISNSILSNELRKASSTDTKAAATKEKTNNFQVKNEENNVSHYKLVNCIKKDIIAMVYPENYQNSSIKILKENTNGNKLELKVSVSWKDQWVKSPYIIEGLLKVQTDGTNAHFKITHKNPQAEALEITYDNFKDEISLAKI